MSETSSRPKSSRQLSLLSAEPPASHSAFRASGGASTIHAATLLFGSLKSFAFASHVGSSGKTSPTSCVLNAEGRWAPLSGRWGNSGIASPGECWTFNTSACPNVASVSCLSDIVEPIGDQPPSLYLTGHNLERMRLRLRRYSYRDNLLLEYLGRCSAGRVTKPRSSESKSRRRSERRKAAKA